ncbi:MAG: hypothetical protein AB1720_13770 [Pseudomonadota bacterium]
MDMDWLSCIERFFNNQSVGAFLGAFSAFILVMLNDWRRDRKKVRNLSAEIEMNLAHAKSKLETVRRNRSLAREQNQIEPAPILKFNTALIRQLSAEILDHLTLDQRRAIEGLCYTMEATDGLLEEIYRNSKRLSGALGQAERMAYADRLLIDFSDAIVNLKRLIEMCENYITRKFGVIVTKQYDRLEYEEP